MSLYIDPDAVKESWLSNRTYDALKWITQLLLPATGTLYFTIAAIWGLPASEQVVGTITAVVFFLGVILGLSTNNYNSSLVSGAGQLVVDTSDPDKDVYRLELDATPEAIANLNEVVLKVVKS